MLLQNSTSPQFYSIRLKLSIIPEPSARMQK
jgi:hypothetical protein